MSTIDGARVELIAPKCLLNQLDKLGMYPLLRTACLTQTISY